MKKLTLLALTAFAVQSYAATVNWGLGADVYLYKQGDSPSTAKIAYESDLSVPSGAYLALVYVGNGVDTFDIGNVTAASVIAQAPYAIDTDNATYCDFDPYLTETQVSSSTYSDGSSFAVVWYNGEGFDYVYGVGDGALNSAITIADIARGNVTLDIASNTTGFGGALSARAASVPEPATGALALAGVALLFRRRKA